MPRGERDSPLDPALSDQPLRFPQKNRLNKSSDYQEVFKSTCRSTDSNFIILVKRNKLSFARLGLAISRKRIQSAVGRNKVKRMIRESFRHNKTDLKGLDVVVIAKKNINYQDRHVIGKSLMTHWRKLLE